MLSPNDPTGAMKIVDVAEFYADEGGGVKTYINQKLRAGADAGHEIVVIAPGPEDKEEQRHGGRILWVKGPHMPFDPRYFVLHREKAVHALLDQEQPDIVEGSSVWTGGWFAARWKGDAAKALIFHQDPIAVYPETFLDRYVERQRINQLFGWYWRYLRTLAKRFDSTVVSGNWLAEKLQAHSIPNAHAVPFGIDKAQFSPDHHDPDIRRALQAACGVSADAPIFVTVSRFHPEKRLSMLLKAFQKVRETHEAGWVIYGHGPQRAAFDRAAEHVPGVHAAGFTSSREALATALSSCDAMLHGSAAETFGLVVAEGICSGLPVIAPDLGGAADLVEPAWGMHYQTGNVEDCARAMRAFLDAGKTAFVDGVQHAASERVQTEKQHFDQLFAYYDQLRNTRG